MVTPRFKWRMATFAEYFSLQKSSQETSGITWLQRTSQCHPLPTFLVALEKKSLRKHQRPPKPNIIQILQNYRAFFWGNQKAIQELFRDRLRGPPEGRMLFRSFGPIAGNCDTHSELLPRGLFSKWKKGKNLPETSSFCSLHLQKEAQIGSKKEMMIASFPTIYFQVRTSKC